MLSVKGERGTQEEVGQEEQEEQEEQEKDLRRPSAGDGDADADAAPARVAPAPRRAERSRNVPAGSVAGITAGGVCWCVIPPPPGEANSAGVRGPPVLRAVVLRGLDTPLMVARLGPHSLREIIKAAGTAPVFGRVGDEAVALGEVALLGFQDPGRVRFRERESEGEGDTGPDDGGE